MFKTLLAATALAGTAIAAPTAMAQAENGAYVEGGYQYFDIKPDGAEQGVDTNAIGARAGYQFNNVFSIEGELATGIDDGEFDYNTDEDEFDLDDNNDGDFEDLIAASGDVQLNYLVGIYGKAEYPVTERLDAYARVGYAYVDIDAELATPGTDTVIAIGDAEDGVAAGAGLSYDLTESLYVKGDYTYYAFENTDTNGVMIGAGYKF